MSVAHTALYEAHTTQRYPLGHEIVEPASRAASDASSSLVANSGPRVWRYVFNDEASTAFAAGDVIVRDPSATTYPWYGGLIAASGTVFSRVMCIGVAQFAIAAGSYGFILVKGQGLMKIGTANISADTPLSTGGSAAGTVIDWADGATTSEAQIGHSIGATTTDNTTISAFIDCAG